MAAMQVLYMGIWKNDSKPAVQLSHQFELPYNRWVAREVKPVMALLIQKVAENVELSQRLSVPDNDESDQKPPKYMCHAYARSEGVCAVVVTNVEYPNTTAWLICGKILDEFISKYPRTAYADVTKDTALPFPELAAHIKKYQNPAEVDSIVQIQSTLDATKIVLQKTVNSVLERGEKIDDLVAKSDTLSAQSKMFYTQAKKQNSCCILM